MEADSHMLNPLQCGLSILSFDKTIQPVLSSKEMSEYLDVYETTGVISKPLYQAIDMVYREAGEDLEKDIPLLIEFQYAEPNEQSGVFRIVNNRIGDYTSISPVYVKEVMDNERILMPEEWMGTFYEKFRKLYEENERAMTKIEKKAREQCSDRGEDYMDPDDKDIMFRR
jgi:hypothetical protein